MIHFIVILHFIVISAGVITLFLAWMQYQAQKDLVFKWVFYTDLVFTINMILDAVRIYVSKNVISVSQTFWPVFHFLLDLFSIAIIFVAFKTIIKATHKPLSLTIKGLFVIIFSLPIITVIIRYLGILINPYIGSYIFSIMLLCCIIYGFLSISVTPTQYRPITAAFSAALMIYLVVYILTTLLQGMPTWVFRIPYTQIIYLLLNILGFVYLIGKMNTQKRLITADNPQRDNMENIKLLSEKYGLTTRELEIISEIIEGKNNREIGNKLFISPNTVKNHAYNIYKKIGIKNRYELIHIISQER